MAAAQQEREALQHALTESNRQLAESNKQVLESNAIAENLTEALIDHETTIEELTYLKGDIALLQFQSEEYKVGLQRCRDVLSSLTGAS